MASFALPGRLLPLRILTIRSIHTFNLSIVRTSEDADLPIPRTLPEIITDSYARQLSQFPALLLTELGLFNGLTLEDFIMLVITMLALITGSLEEAQLVHSSLLPLLVGITRILTLDNALSTARTLLVFALSSLA